MSSGIRSSFSVSPQSDVFGRKDLPGALDPLAIELAKSQSLAVDFPKTGVPPSVPQATLEGLKSNGFPDFMQKPGAETWIEIGKGPPWGGAWGPAWH